MIIDAHTHIGDFVKISMPEDVFWHLWTSMILILRYVPVDLPLKLTMTRTRFRMKIKLHSMITMNVCSDLFVNMQSELARLCGLSLVWKVVIKILKI